MSIGAVQVEYWVYAVLSRFADSQGRICPHRRSFIWDAERDRLLQIPTQQPEAAGGGAGKGRGRVMAMPAASRAPTGAYAMQMSKSVSTSGILGVVGAGMGKKGLTKSGSRAGRLTPAVAATSGRERALTGGSGREQDKGVGKGVDRRRGELGGSAIVHGTHKVFGLSGVGSTKMLAGGEPTGVGEGGQGRQRKPIRLSVSPPTAVRYNRHCLPKRERRSEAASPPCRTRDQ